mgnify:CR=1 FL=1
MKRISLSKPGLFLLILGLFSYLFCSSLLIREEIRDILQQTKLQLENKSKHMATHLEEKLKEICVRVELIALNPVIQKGGSREVAALLEQIANVDVLCAALLVLEADGSLVAAGPVESYANYVPQETLVCEGTDCKLTQIQTAAGTGYYALSHSTPLSNSGDQCRLVIAFLDLKQAAGLALPGSQPDHIALLTQAGEEMVLLSPKAETGSAASFPARLLASFIKRKAVSFLEVSSVITEPKEWVVSLSRPYETFQVQNLQPIFAGFKFNLLLIFPLLFLAVLTILAVNRSRLSFQEQARRDGLTGLYNHRFFQERLRDILKGSHNDPVSLLMLDLDNFKCFNDAYGHQAGDRKLKKVAAVLLANVRSTDLVARYGGEEFAVVLPGLNLKEAVQIGERIKESVKTRCGNTISIGVSSFPQYAFSAEELIQTADDALYQAKELSKDRVISVKNQKDS